MRIGMFLDCDLQRVNGLVSSIETLRAELKARGHEVFLFVPGDDRRVTRPASNTFAFRSNILFFAPEHRLAYPWPRSVLRDMADLRLDVVHLHSPFTVGLVGLWHARKRGLPIVVTHHTRWEEYLAYLPVFGINHLKRLAIFLATAFNNAGHAVIAPSSSMKDVLLQQGVKRPISVLPTGINRDMFTGGDRDGTRRQLGLGGEHKVCVCIARLAPEKNLEFVLRGFAKVAAQDSRARLVVIGDGPARQGLQALAASLGLSDAVQFTGYILRTELRHYLAAADVFVFASLTETQGLVVIEAMAAGLPVVTVDAPGVRDEVVEGHTGYLTPHDQSAWASRVLEVLHSDVLRRRLGKASEERCEAFRSSAMADHTLEIYASLVGEKAREPAPLAEGA